jgi:hypothetical protein
MMTEPNRVAEACRAWAVEGEIIQIARNNILFRPRVSTHPFRLELDSGGDREPAIGPATLIILPAAFECRRLLPRRGESPKRPELGYHSDEIEFARGRLVARLENPDLAILDIGFPVVVEQLEPCPELGRAQIDDMIELEIAPPTRATLL